MINPGQFIVNHLALSSMGISIVSGIAANYLPGVISNWFAKEISLIDEITDPDWKAWVVDGLVLIHKKFPFGANQAVGFLLDKVHWIIPVADPLTKFLTNLQIKLSDDINAQISKDGR